MKNILSTIHHQLKGVTTVSYLDENWGQLDSYTANTPVEFPCLLIDAANVTYSNMGRDFNITPQERQQAQVALSLTIADMRLDDTRTEVSENEEEDTWRIWDSIAEIHGALQGFIPSETASALMRTTVQRTQRTDGIQAYNVVYTFAVSNV